MSETAKTVLISLFTSIVVSLFTYILGLKSGKNQSVIPNGCFRH